MIDPIDVWRSAGTLLRFHGDEAASLAMERAEVLKAEGDDEGHAVMMRIADAVRELQKQKPDGGAPH